MAHARNARNRRWRSTRRSIRRNWPRYAVLALLIVAGLSMIVLALNALASSGDARPMPVISE